MPRKACVSRGKPAGPWGSRPTAWSSGSWLSGCGARTASLVAGATALGGVALIFAALEGLICIILASRNSTPDQPHCTAKTNGVKVQMVPPDEFRKLTRYVALLPTAATPGWNDV